MTYAQIGHQPFKACGHSDDRPKCHICANYADVVSREAVAAIRTDTGERGKSC